jgi:DNA-binding LytR/AlgR family response regulator
MPARGNESALVAAQLYRSRGELDPTVFCRIHRSTIVNLDRVRPESQR